MKVKLQKSGSGFFFLLFTCLLFIVNCPLRSQNISPNAVQNNTNAAVEQINKIGDEAKAKYAENIDNPYIPTRVNPEYDLETVKETLIRALKKYVNYYAVSKVPAYKNTGSNLTMRNIKNGEVTNDYIRFTSGQDNHSKDTVTIYYHEILNYWISYYVKVTEGGFYMPYVKVKDHLLTCGGKEMADLLFYMQHQYAIRYYEQDLVNFTTVAEKYRTLTEKPTLSAEQRKLFVQGNVMNDHLDVETALIYYDKALQLDPISYPEGYYNYALIAASAERYELAIVNMKKYLLLMPDAQDAVAAQDKIYEWEALMTRK